MQKMAIETAARFNGDLVKEPYKSMIDIIGLESFLEFLWVFGGTHLYVPKPRSAFARCIDEEIKRLFNGYNFKELVSMFGFSETYVRDVLRKSTSESF